MPDESKLLEQLSAPFDPKVIKKNQSGYHYIQIDEVYNRLDEVAGLSWALFVEDVNIQTVDPSWKTYGRLRKTAFLASVTARITLADDGFGSITRTGVGADFADDPDKAIKTALANAVKKAANGFGVGRYLWKEEERAAIDEANQARNDVKELKKRVLEKYLDGPDAPADVEGFKALSPADKMAVLAAYFKVDVVDLASAETLNKILEGES